MRARRALVVWRVSGASAFWLSLTARAPERACACVSTSRAARACIVRGFAAESPRRVASPETAGSGTVPCMQVGMGALSWGITCRCWLGFRCGTARARICACPAAGSPALASAHALPLGRPRPHRRTRCRWVARARIVTDLQRGRLRPRRAGASPGAALTRSGRTFTSASMHSSLFELRPVLRGPLCATLSTTCNSQHRPSTHQRQDAARVL